MAATYHVALEGLDTNPGTAELPWCTIQQAVKTALPGDTVLVRAGTYPERISTVRGGTNEFGRIRFVAEGVVRMNGWRINHSFITIQGFEISGWSAPSKLTAYVQVTRSGDFTEVLNCTLQNGLQLVCPDAVFDSTNSTITSASGGFLTAGFAAGQTLFVGNATNGVRLNSTNDGTFEITAISDQAITVAGSLADQGPLPVYLSASYVYGLLLDTGSEGCVIRSNRLRNLGYDAAYLGGISNLVERNVIERCNGWDAMHVGGTNNVFRGNILRDSPLRVYQVSPDAWESGASLQYRDLLFTNNFIVGFAGVIASQKGAPVGQNLVMSHNVFVDTGPFLGTHPHTIFQHNTFLRVARTNTPVTSVFRHPLRFETVAGATNITLRNNVFVDCGQWSERTPEAIVGWYEFNGPVDLVVREGNFVAGAPPQFAAKTGWPEVNPALNGGDPGFVNLNDPLGPDGLPFTDDDGLRLKPDSKLIGAGIHGRTPGAYEQPFSPRVRLGICRSGDHVRLFWPQGTEEWILMLAVKLAGPWMEDTNSPVPYEGYWSVLLEPTNTSKFFLLRR